MSNEYSSSLHLASAEYRDFDPPPPGTKRWVTRREAVIVNAVRTGFISLEEVCRRYELSVDEFLAWQRAIIPTECRVYASPGSKSIATTRLLG